DTGAFSLDETGHELLRPDQRPARIGRAAEARAVIKAAQSASAECADRNGETGAHAQREAERGASQSGGKRRTSKPRHAVGGAQAGGLSDGGRPRLLRRPARECSRRGEYFGGLRVRF